jgi:predicted GIY-YIG superfamily endonuclease
MGLHMKRTDISCPKCGQLIVFMDNYYTCWDLSGSHCGYRPEGPVGTLPESLIDYKSRKKREKEEIHHRTFLATIEDEKKVEQERKNRQRVIIDSEFRLDYWLKFLRTKYGKTMSEATKDVYVLELKSIVETNHLALAIRTFPSANFPEITKVPKGFLYVGVAADVNHRFLVHNGTVTSGKSRPARVAKLDFLKNSNSFENCGGKLTEKYGIKQIGWRQGDQYEKLESWLGYALYKAGYWIWGPHRHEKEDFLESGDFI